MTFQLRTLDLQGTGKNSMSALRALKKVSPTSAIPLFARDKDPDIVQHHFKADSGRSMSSYRTNTPIRARALAL